MADSDRTFPGLSLQRLMLLMVTALVALVLTQSLVNSWNQPQVASQLELYQTNLLLEGSSWQGAGLPEEQWPTLRQGLLGKDPVGEVAKQYQQLQQRARDNLEKLSVQSPLGESTQAGKPLPRRQQNALNQQRALIDQIDLQLGLIEAHQGKEAAAISRWGNLRDRPSTAGPLVRTADTLVRLWQYGQAKPGDDLWLEQHLEGWFAYRALDQLYSVTQQSQERQRLEAQEQVTAQNRLVKLVAIGTLPEIGALGGIGLSLFLVIQRFLKGEQSLLRLHAGQGWTIPWTGETIWQVLVLGFFFVGQILLPVLLGTLGIESSALSSRDRAWFSLGYYLVMAAGSLGVLWWSIRSYRPLPEGLFDLKPSPGAFLWGLGGYLVALPLMFGIALVNQQIWQGQGGSNPMLETVLREQDPVALGIFFLTAAVAAPLFEETLFRGFLLPSLTRYMGLGWAIGLSGFVFAAAHLSLSEVLPLTLLGIVLGFVYSRSRNLLSSMVLHSLWNSATMVGLLLLSQ